LQTYGLSPPAVVVKVTLTKDKKPTTHVYELGHEKKAEKELDKGVYLKLGGKDLVYVVNRILLTDAKQELRDPTIFDYKADAAAALKITFFRSDEGAQVTRTLEKKGGQWVRADAPTWTVDQDKVKDLLNELSSLRADKFVPTAKGADDKKKALTLE